MLSLFFFLVCFCFSFDRMSSSNTFKTPKNCRVKSFGSDGGTPINIPSSPFMKKLGCGTGVSVYLMDRLDVVNLS